MMFLFGRCLDKTPQKQNVKYKNLYVLTLREVFLFFTWFHIIITQSKLKFNDFFRHLQIMFVCIFFNFIFY